MRRARSQISSFASSYRAAKPNERSRSRRFNKFPKNENALSSRSSSIAEHENAIKKLFFRRSIMIISTVGGGFSRLIYHFFPLAETMAHKNPKESSSGSY
jgi:hypothetical protein